MAARVAICAEPGLAVEFRQGGKIDRLVLPYASLHVGPTNAPARFLEPGPFSAEFAGWISVELRAQYTFTVESSAAVELLINGKAILSATNRSGAARVSNPVRLSKGTNAFLLRMDSPADSNQAAAQTGMSVQVLWSSRNNPVPVPIPTSALSHAPDEGLERSFAAHKGAFLVQQFRCAKCHLPDAVPSGVGLDAPSFDGIGSRLNADWIARWTRNPAGLRSARMPQIFHGAEAAAQSEAVAAYLASLTDGRDSRGVALNAALSAAGETHFRGLNCGSCHTLPGEPAMAERMSLNHVREKFRPLALTRFLENPHAHYPSNPMPYFRLSAEESAGIAVFLLQRAPAAKNVEPPDPTLVAKGKALVQTSGCLNCHQLDGLANSFSAPSFSVLSQGALERGCLDATSNKAPRFTFAPGEKDDIKAFLARREPAVLVRTVPHENAIHYTQTLQCAQCHQESGLPDPLTLGGKLKPEWAARFIAGKVPYKPRPWLKARMPGFPAYAEQLATGLAALHGYSAQTPPEAPADSTLATLGAKLVSSAGGFSCVACHPVGSASSAVVVESPGVNLAYSGERLLGSFYHRWLMNPIAIDPSTKMPVYFDAQGRSQLTEFFDGDAAKQIDAIWHYLRLGEKMPPPPAP